MIDTDVRRDERVEVDRNAPPIGTGPSLAAADYPPLTPSATRSVLSSRRSVAMRFATRPCATIQNGGSPERHGQAYPRHRAARASDARDPAPSARLSSSPGSVVARPPTSLTADEEARAAELEAKIVAEEQLAEDALRRTRDRAREAPVVVARTREAVPLAVRAADEYAYVRRDVFRIARIGGLLVGILAMLYVLINVLHVVTF